MASYVSEQYRLGLAEEKKVRLFLVSQGFKVFKASKEEDMFEDIDLWVGDIPVSVKAQHEALRYGANRSVYFELAQLERETGEWVPSWFYTGKAEKYLILQGKELMLIDKLAVIEYIKVKPWIERTLTEKRRQALINSGKYRYVDSRCGYILQKDVPVEKLWIIEDNNA